MEKESLKGLFTKMMESMQNAQISKDQEAESKSPIDKAHYRKTKGLHENRVKHYSDKIDTFGKGFPMVQVTGQRRVNRTMGGVDLGIEVTENFVYYLYGVTEPEAEMLMKAQVIKNNLIEKSLQFRTIEFRNYITILV